MGLAEPCGRHAPSRAPSWAAWTASVSSVTSAPKACPNVGNPLLWPQAEEQPHMAGAPGFSRGWQAEGLVRRAASPVRDVRMSPDIEPPTANRPTVGSPTANRKGSHMFNDVPAPDLWTPGGSAAAPPHRPRAVPAPPSPGGWGIGGAGEPAGVRAVPRSPRFSESHHAWAAPGGAAGPSFAAAAHRWSAPQGAAQEAAGGFEADGWRAAAGMGGLSADGVQRHARASQPRPHAAAEHGAWPAAAGAGLDAAAQASPAAPHSAELDAAGLPSFRLAGTSAVPGFTQQSAVAFNARMDWARRSLGLE
jgi:hypothetical protein